MCVCVLFDVCELLLLIVVCCCRVSLTFAGCRCWLLLLVVVLGSRCPLLLFVVDRVLLAVVCVSVAVVVRCRCWLVDVVCGVVVVAVCSGRCYVLVFVVVCLLLLLCLFACLLFPSVVDACRWCACSFVLSVVLVAVVRVVCRRCRC